MVVTVASTSAVRCTGTALRAAVIRIAVTGGLTLLACVFGSAVANAATSSDVPPPNAIANTLQSDLSDIVNSVLKGLGGHQHEHHHVGLGLGGVAAIQPPADDGDGNSQGNGNGNGQGNGNQGAGQSSSSGGGSTAATGQSGSSDVWTGSTTVTVPTKTVPQPPQQPAPPPPPPAHVQQPPPPADHSVEQAQKPTEPSMGAPVGVAPDLPQRPLDLPLQQPVSQPISSPSTGGSASHDFGANGIADIVPPGTGFRPSPGSTTEEHNAKRVSDGVPGLPSTSPD